MKSVGIILVAVLLLLAGSGCSKGCGGDCLHGGTCNNGVCGCIDNWFGDHCDTQCTLGYEGRYCTTLSRDKFIGTWNCQSNGVSFLIDFTPDNTQPEYMFLRNFNNKGYTMRCTLTGITKFDINPQTATGTIHALVSGNAQMNGSSLIIYLSEDNVQYFATATKQ